VDRDMADAAKQGARAEGCSVTSFILRAALTEKCTESKSGDDAAVSPSQLAPTEICTIEEKKEI